MKWINYSFIDWEGSYFLTPPSFPVFLSIWAWIGLINYVFCLSGYCIQGSGGLIGVFSWYSIKPQHYHRLIHNSIDHLLI